MHKKFNNIIHKILYKETIICNYLLGDKLIFRSEIQNLTILGHLCKYLGILQNN